MQRPTYSLKQTHCLYNFAISTSVLELLLLLARKNYSESQLLLDMFKFHDQFFLIPDFSLTF